MSNPTPNYGSRIMSNRKWATKLVISTDEAPAGKFILDPALPILGRDPSFLTSDDTVIPKGRFLGVKNTQTSSIPAYANANTPIITLANGTEGLVDGSGNPTDIKPLGFSEEQFFQDKGHTGQEQPYMLRHQLIEVPYIQASNGAQGALKPGDKVTAYSGTVTTAPAVANEIGKPVKWVARRTYGKTQASSATVQLTNAIYPAFKPRVLFALNAGAGVNITSAVYSFVGGNWQVLLNAAVTDVVYEWGQLEDNIAGVVMSFEAVGTAGGLIPAHEWEGWLRWVVDDYKQFPFPPVAAPRPFGSLTAQVPTTIDAFTYRIANVPLIVTQPINVYITGSIMDPITGVVTPLATLTLLPQAGNNFFTDYTQGLYYEINPLTGIISFSNNVTVTTITVDYTYENSYADGRLFGGGVQGLTSGQFSGVPGTPANLELLGVVAAMRILTI